MIVVMVMVLELNVVVLVMVVTVKLTVQLTDVIEVDLVIVDAVDDDVVLVRHWEKTNFHRFFKKNQKCISAEKSIFYKNRKIF